MQQFIGHPEDAARAFSSKELMYCNPSAFSLSPQMEITVFANVNVLTNSTGHSETFIYASNCKNYLEFQHNAAGLLSSSLSGYVS